MKMMSVWVSALLALFVSACTSVNDDDKVVIGVATDAEKQVLIHYLPWFADENYAQEPSRHWSHGTVNEALVGEYDSQSWATQLYHILLSAAVGVDGAMINIRTDYDKDALSIFMESLERVRAVYPDFAYHISASIDDQDKTEALAQQEFEYIAELIDNYTTYLHKNGKPVIFIWAYNNLTPAQYRSIADQVFGEDEVILVQNDIDTSAVADEINMNAFYPWVKGFADDGSDWGEVYLDWFYRTSADYLTDNKQEFIVAGVWPGFDDRQVNWYGDDYAGRWIDRADGAIYDNTWQLIDTFNNEWQQDIATEDISIDWVVIETWNDFNEGSEIEPIAATADTESFQYLKLTDSYITNFKATDSVLDADDELLNAAVKIYQAAKLIDDGDRASANYYSTLEQAIEAYLKADAEGASDYAETIIDG
ncbi:hypothetical protein [Reinekea thalattae]|uniref:GH26 domain-containing protein n=1 Tax=Reinekea thalattae TaxID=2593301 RepID=A0A5C8Z5D5_9GAMM|nr:hypothetical protein [Reinekea thalattae]TXR52116.1 hypothetical protein FME95_11925 [Reinekea thalattae]